MQTTKSHIRKLLLDTARSSFFEKGFKAVSMREISKRSGVGLSNIYNYYPNKDSLLADVLHPLLRDIDQFMAQHNTSEHLTIKIFTSEDIQRKWLETSLGIVSRYRNELKLLFFASHGSRFENFEEEWIDKTTSTGIEYIEEMKARYPQLHADISTFFIRFISAWWVSMIKELLRHEELSEREIECFVGEHLRFTTGGWGKLMQEGSPKRNKRTLARIGSSILLQPPTT